MSETCWKLLAED